MIVELTAAQLPALLPLFSGSPYHKIARSACLGLVPCRAFADSAVTPSAAVLSLARFGIAFAAGDAAHAPALLDALRGGHPWYEIADPPAAWHPALADSFPETYATIRYGFSEDPAAFDRDALRALAVPPEGCELRPLDHALIDQALLMEWSEDQIGAFTSTGAFLRDGLGVALVRDGALVAGCASFCAHPDGYEVQIDTHPDHRKKGYAACVGAAFLLESLARGKVPCWDAANRASLRLARKLGFRLASAYTAWMLISGNTTAEAVEKRVIGETPR